MKSTFNKLDKFSNPLLPITIKEILIYLQRVMGDKDNTKFDLDMSPDKCLPMRKYQVDPRATSRWFFQLHFNVTSNENFFSYNFCIRNVFMNSLMLTGLVSKDLFACTELTSLDYLKYKVVKYSKPENTFERLWDRILTERLSKAVFAINRRTPLLSEWNGEYFDYML